MHHNPHWFVQWSQCYYIVKPFNYLSKLLAVIFTSYYYFTLSSHLTAFAIRLLQPQSALTSVNETHPLFSAFSILPIFISLDSLSFSQLPSTPFPTYTLAHLSNHPSNHSSLDPINFCCQLKTQPKLLQCVRLNRVKIVYNLLGMLKNLFPSLFFSNFIYQIIIFIF